jgi:subtilisin family serine protease
MSVPRWIYAAAGAMALAVAVPVVTSGQAVPAAEAPDAPFEVAAGGPDDETPELWFVELQSAPLAEGASAQTLSAESEAFHTQARQRRLDYSARFTYRTLFNGLSIRARKESLSQIRRLPGVKALWPVVEVKLHREVGLEVPELNTALAMTGADIAQSSLGLTGAGVKVAVMDSGIDYDHPDLGGCFGPGCRVSQGWDFVGDAFNADPTSPSYNPVPVPDDDPDDCLGHGTHVAGIVGANGTVRGVAPGVSFGSYRVFGCEGSTTADIMLAAMERALADGNHILNMSIGSAFQWPQYPTALAASRLVNRGMVVVASAGNNGTSGVYGSAAPAVGEKVISVASVDNVADTLPYFTVSPTATRIGFSAASGAPAPPTSGTSPMARTGTSTSTDDACNALPAGSLSGKVALVRRGTCSFHQKAFNAQAVGAIGVVLYNNVPGRVGVTVAGTPAIEIPVVAISDSEGVLIDGRIAAGPVDMTWTALLAKFPSVTGGQISSFSSWGLSPDLALKPDISAPGGSIHSTFPLELGGYANVSGTSMSSPHVAGAAALLLQARPGTAPARVRTIFQNSADPKPWPLIPSLGLLDAVHRQGAGLLDVDDAILARTRVDPGKLELGESASGPITRRLTITRRCGWGVTYDLSYVNGVSTGGIIAPTPYGENNGTVTFDTPTVVLPPCGRAEVEATFTPPSGPAFAQYGGWIVLTPREGGPVYRVPFAGFLGDYQSIVALTPTTNGFPWLARVVGTSFVKQGAGAVFTLEDGDIPYFLAHFEHQVRRLRLSVVEVTRGRSWNFAYDEQYWGRNSSSTSFFALPWDGQTFKGQRTFVVPDGQYVVILAALKALGDPANAAHWETWTSPVLTIDRP